MSKNINLNDKNWIDIVFENRNHEYGAYQIRKNYNRNSILGIVGMFSFLGIAFGCILLFSSFKDKYLDAPEVDVPKLDTIFFVLPEKEIIEEEIIEPVEPAGTPPAEPTQSQAFNIPEVVPDNTVPTDLLPPTQEELEGKTISTVTNTEGTGGINEEIITPESGSGSGGTSTGYELIADKMPEFPGGEEALLNHIKKNAKFTRTALENNASGTIYVSFIVDERGEVIQPKIEKGIGFGMDEMVLNVIKNLPSFTPAEQNGRKVKIKLMVPVRFQLN